MANQSDYRSRQGRGYIADLVYETPGYGEGPEHADDISLSSDAYGHENWNEETQPDANSTTSGSGTAPFAGRGPKGYQGRSADSRLWSNVCHLLADDSHLDAEDITVEVLDGEVTLTGTVDSKHSKRLAEDLAGSLRGVHDVHNRLRIRKDETSG